MSLTGMRPVAMRGAVAACAVASGRPSPLERTAKASRARRASLLVVLALAGAAPVSANEWPTRPVTVVMPYRPGGGGETMVRLVMNNVSQHMGRSFVIENRPGGGGTIGATAVSKERPDGYTLLGSNLATMVVAPVLVGVNFDPLKDFTHIALFGGPPPALAVTSSLQAKTLKEYVELSRNRPSGITYASSGHGTHVHLMAELFQTLSGANLVHVPYSGGGPAMADLVAGHVSSALVTLGTVSQYVRNGQVRLLAVASPQRVRDFPDVPTFAELGYNDMTSITWFGLSGPAGISRDIALKLNKEVRAAMVRPEVMEKLAAEAIEPGNLDPDGYTQYIRDEIARWAPLARRINEAKPAQAR